MDVWSPSDVPVGILWWNGPTRRLTVIAKMTLVPRGKALVLADEQEPLRMASPSALGVVEEHHHPSDFVPFKPRCDVLLVGSAYASTPQSVISIFIRVGALERQVYALAGQPSNTIPLSSMYLRREANHGAEEVAVGPLSVQHPHRACVADPRVPAQASLFENASLPPDFDGRCFHAAPLEQQIDPITPGTPLVVPWHGAESQNFWIPPMAPRIFLFDRTTESGLREVAMTCDTMWIDTDRTRCVLTFRGVIDPGYGGSFPTALVAVFASIYDAVLANAATTICAQATSRQATEPQALEGFVAESVAAAPPPTTPSVARSPSFHDDEGTNLYTNLVAPTSAVPFVSALRPGERFVAESVAATPPPTAPSVARSPSFHDDEGTSLYTNLVAPSAAVPFVSPSQAPVRGAAMLLQNVQGSHAPILPFGGGASALAAMPESRLVPVDRRAEAMPQAAPVLPFVQALRAQELVPGPTVAMTSRKSDTIIPTAAPTTALPFVPVSRPVDAWPERQVLGASPNQMQDVTTRTALPFGSNESRKRPSTLPPTASFVTTDHDQPLAVPAQALPFVSTDYDRPLAPPAQALPFVSTDFAQAPLGGMGAPLPAASSFAVLGSGASPTPSVFSTALDTAALMRISLDTFAEIKLDLWSGVGLRDALAKHGIDQRSYRLHERRQTHELGDDVRQGALDRTHALRAALRRARERRAPLSTDDGIL